ncbi:hypothetical protein DL346_11940 [Paenibacillus montanisoli]|uniref:Uncharacterized protein n=1 Tax=Paenibacillus montanisoli TaxID=2081970 RepID=A0A328U241_9BACL|nr:hypothetical protein DL346_11940 [Paenibacillus montanisoli]
MIRFMVYSLFILLLGLVSITVGIIKGRVWAVDYINPATIGSIEAREGITNAFIYCPVIFGGVLVVLGLVIFAIVFSHWTKKHL